jgi:hypothetical protein
MAFLNKLEKLYENKLEELEDSYAEHSENFLNEELDVEDIKESLTISIVEIMSQHYQKVQRPNKVEAYINKLRVGKIEDGSYLRDLILPYKFWPIYSQYIGKRDVVGLIKAIECTGPFSRIKNQIESSLGVEFKYNIDIKFRTDSAGICTISCITWEPRIYFNDF